MSNRQNSKKVNLNVNNNNKTTNLNVVDSSKKELTIYEKILLSKKQGNVNANKGDNQSLKSSTNVSLNSDINKRPLVKKSAQPNQSEDATTKPRTLQQQIQQQQQQQQRVLNEKKPQESNNFSSSSQLQQQPKQQQQQQQLQQRIVNNNSSKPTNGINASIQLKKQQQIVEDQYESRSPSPSLSQSISSAREPQQQHHQQPPPQIPSKNPTLFQAVKQSQTNFKQG